MYKGFPVRLKADSSSEIREARNQRMSHSKCWEKKNKNSLSSGNHPSETKDNLRHCELREFIISRSTLQEILVFLARMKGHWRIT